MNIINNIGLEVRRYLRTNFFSLKAAADHYGVSTAYLSPMQTGKKPPSKAIRRDMGIKLVSVWVKSEKEGEE